MMFEYSNLPLAYCKKDSSAAPESKSQSKYVIMYTSENILKLSMAPLASKIQTDIIHILG